MNINFNKTEGALSIALEGRLDTVTAPELERFLADNYDGKSALMLDLEKLAYISSAGLRVLLGAQKKSKGKMTLSNATELVMEVFEMTGFADILEIV